MSYLNTLLANQALDDDELNQLSSHRTEVKELLEGEFGNDATIKYAGSKAKGTMIRESYDLDIVCYLPEDEERTLKEIYQDTKAILSENYVIDARTSAIRIINPKGGNGDYHIDVVPGKFIKDSDDVFIYVSTADKERMQTNIKVHITTVKESGCQDIIKLAKLWKVRNNLTFRTFVLELAVIEALKGYDGKSDLEKSFKKVLTFLQDKIKSVRLIDPANSGNPVSDLVSKADKEMIALSAENSLSIIESADEPGDSEWRRVFREVVTSTNANTPISESRVNKPWLNG